MSGLFRKLGRTLVWFITSIIVAAGFVFISMIILDELRVYDNFVSYEVLIIIFFGLSIILTRLTIFKDKDGKSRWGSPQFKGRFDREKGILEATARMVAPERLSHQAWYHGTPMEFTVYRLRAEILDDMGSPIEYVPIEIRGETNKWVGTLVDGDRIRVEGKFEKDGILHSKNGFNYSTNSYFGEKK